MDRPPPAAYAVAVRTLCAFAAKCGDLDTRFTPAPSAQEGVAGHRVVASRRGDGHRSEVAVSGAWRHLVVRGRVDGFDAARGRVEEVKTFRGDLARMPANHRALHWAQAKVYGHLLCDAHGLDAIDVALVYFDVDRQEEAAPLVERCTRDALATFFDALCERFAAWADRELVHRVERDRALDALAFPHATFRDGQRVLAKDVFNATRSGRLLMAQAPTGIGKTIATVFPALKAMPRERVDKLLFLTAKGSGAATAFDTLRRLDDGALRVVELTARDKACEHPTLQCHGESCPLAAGFYDRLPAARVAAADRAFVEAATLRAVARDHAVCPYYLAQEMARWADVVVADYHYWFDTHALLHALAIDEGWRVVALVDEAHNLLERAREMYGAVLASSTFAAARLLAPAALRPPFDVVHRAWGRVARDQEALHVLAPEPPKRLVVALDALCSAIEAHADRGTDALDPEVRRFHFDALRFVRLAESFGPHSMFDIRIDPPAGMREKRHRASTLAIRNVVPAPFLKPRFAALHAGALFSATLTPRRFYADTLGLPDDTAWLDVASPFDADQLAVRVVHTVSTRWTHRPRSLAPIARLIASQARAAPGNYLAFFSSHDYLEQVRAALVDVAPELATWSQSRAMDRDARERFLARFEADGRGVAFAVLGGSFGEGIDLVGTRLVGAFIATLGMPQVNVVNEAMRERLDAQFGSGFDYTYLYPGLRRVVQAAGRVIRGPADRGSVWLIDDRFDRPEVRALLPAWWRVERFAAGFDARQAAGATDAPSMA